MQSSPTFYRQCAFATLYFSVFCVATLAAGIPAARAAARDVGGVFVELSPPKGYVSCKEVGNGLLERLETSVPKDNMLIDGYVAKGDAQKFSSRRPAAFDTYFLVEVAKPTQKLEFSDTDFAALKRYMKRRLSEGWSTRVQEASKVEIVERKLPRSHSLGSNLDAVGEGEIKLIEFLPETKRAITYITASRTEANVIAGSVPATLITATSLVNVKRRVLLLHIVSTYRGRNDLRWLRSHSAAWTKQVTAANP
jgi:hypothetical protein